MWKEGNTEFYDLAPKQPKLILLLYNVHVHVPLNFEFPSLFHCPNFNFYSIFTFLSHLQISLS